jgi:cell division septum initiation protein DivIVA
MTKAEEMKQYRAFASSYPEDSYLGKWLRDNADLIEVDIRNDHFPTLTPRESHSHGQKIIAEANASAKRTTDIAKSEADRILADAKKTAAQLIAQAERECSSITRSFQSELRSLQSKLQSFAA